MNTRILLVTVCLVGAAASLFGLAVIGGSHELSVGQILRGQWPPADLPAEQVARTQVALVGYCSAVERPVGPRWIEIVDQPLGEGGYDQQPIRVRIEAGASMPDEVRVRAWTRVRGRYDPDTGEFTANRVEMKCPSVEEQREQDLNDPASQRQPVFSVPAGPPQAGTEGDAAAGYSTEPAYDDEESRRDRRVGEYDAPADE